MQVTDAARLLARKAELPAILVFDIETTPIDAYCWRVWQENVHVEQIKKPSELLCFAAKWLGEPTIAFHGRLSPKGRYARSDRELATTLWELFDRADVLVAHNGRAFDAKTMNARFVAAGLPPPSPYKVFDTCLVARRTFNFPHNSLAGLAAYLKLGAKVAHEGFSLWLRCMAGDREAWQQMEAYNIQDVLLLEEVYTKLRAWASPNPANVALLYPPGAPRCVCCGSTALVELVKTALTAVNEYPAFRCRSCGRICRSGSRVKGRREKDVLRGVL